LVLFSFFSFSFSFSFLRVLSTFVFLFLLLFLLSFFVFSNCKKTEGLCLADIPEEVTKLPDFLKKNIGEVLSAAWGLLYRHLLQRWP